MFNPHSDVQDWSDVPDATEFQVIPAGKYQVVCTAMERGVSQNGNPKWEYKVQVLGGQYHGVEIIDNITFAEGKALERAKFVLSRFGDVDMRTKWSLSAVNLVGKQAVADVIIEKREYQGKEYTSNKIAFTGYDRPEGFQYVPVSTPPPTITGAATAYAPPNGAPPPQYAPPQQQVAYPPSQQQAPAQPQYAPPTVYQQPQGGFVQPPPPTVQQYAAPAQQALPPNGHPPNGNGAPPQYAQAPPQGYDPAQQQHGLPPAVGMAPVGAGAPAGPGKLPF